MVGIVSLSEAKSTLLSKGHGHFIPTVVLLFVQVMFAANTIVVKAVLEGSEADPLFFLSCRAVIAVICLFLLASHSLGWKLPCIDADLHVPLMLLGFFGVVGNQVLFIYGLDLTSPTVHGIVQPSVAVWTMAICVAMGYERLTGLKFVGLLASVVGSIIVILSPRVSLDQPSVDSGHGGVQETQQNDEEFHSFIMGVAMLLLHTLSYAIYLVRQKEVLKKLHPTVTALYTFAYGGAGEIILASKSILALDLSSIETSFWFAAFYAGFVTSGIGYFLSMWAVKHTTPTLASLCSTMQPMAVAILSYFFRDEVVTFSHAIGGLCILFGLVCTVSAQNQSTGMEAEFSASSCAEKIVSGDSNQSPEKVV